MKNTLTLDIPQGKFGEMTVALAKTVTTCDACMNEIGGKYPEYGSISTYLGGYGAEKHFCGLGCMASYLDKQDEQDGIVHDYSDEEKNDGKEATARYISTKKRNHLKSNQFIDPSRRSFPIENCTDVKAAVHAWGRYKGSMSHAEFKERLTLKAKELGCTLPESWS